MCIIILVTPILPACPLPRPLEWEWSTMEFHADGADGRPLTPASSVNLFIRRVLNVSMTRRFGYPGLFCTILTCALLTFAVPGITEFLPAILK